MSVIRLNGEVADYLQEGSQDFVSDANIVKARYCWVRSEFAGTISITRIKATLDINGNATGTTGDSLGEIYLGPGESLLLEKEPGEVWKVTSYSVGGNSTNQAGTGSRVYFAACGIGG